MPARKGDLASSVTHGDTRAVQSLLSAGHKPDASCPDFAGGTALHIAAFQGLSKIARLLIDAGANVQAIDSCQQTPLHIVGDLATAKVLVEAGADPNVKDDRGRSALHLATRANLLELVKVCLAAGADPELATDAGKTPLELAPSKAVRAMLEAAILRQGRGNYADPQDDSALGL